jgi:mediator of RNA polymerase II transcription subunit 16
VEIVKLKWISEEDPESLMVLSNHNEGSSLEIWTQCEELVPIHKLLQTNKNSCFKTNVWKNKSVYKNAARAINLITSKLGFGSNVIFIALQDNSINCLHREGLKRLAGVSFKGGYTYRSNNDIENIGKHSRISSRVLSFDSTHFGHLLIVLDSIGQISCYKCNFIINDILEIPQNSVTASVNLLEFCLISGLDTYDLMLALKPQLLESIIDKLTENFNRQPTFFVQYYYVKFLTMKINLQRLSSSGQSKANDLMCLLNLHSILTAFKSLLRPSDLVSREKGPAENLSMILSESVPDVDKVLLNLEAKDFTVEPSILQVLSNLNFIRILKVQSITLKTVTKSNILGDGFKKTLDFETIFLSD